ncbi:MAG: RNA polymerase sigma factor [Ilumatobacter sp.]
MTGRRASRDAQRCEDAELVASACAGDDHAFAALFRRHAPDLVRFVERRCGSPSTADDVVAATFERAWTQVCDLSRRHVAFRPWVFRLAGNELIDVMRSMDRRRRREERASQADVNISAGSEPDGVPVVHGIDADTLRAALSTLSATHQEVIALRWFGDLDVQEVAAALDITSGAVAVRAHRATTALRTALSETRPRGAGK